MKKRELLKLRMLKASRTMMRAKEKDKCELKTAYSGYYSRDIHKYFVHSYYRFLDAEIENGILKVGIWERDKLKAAGQEPSFTIFIDKEKEDYITYDHQTGRWLEGMIFKLPYIEDPAEQYKSYWWSTEGTRKLVTEHLEVQGTAKAAVRKFQVATKHGKIKQYHKSELEEIDEFMQSVPEYPKDYNNEWLLKYGMLGNIDMFYHPGRKVTEGYCTRCQKMVPIKDKPKHLMKSKCSRCHTEVTYRSWGRQTIVVHEKCVGILQRTLTGELCLSTTSVRVQYKREEDYKNPNISSGMSGRFRLGASYLNNEAFEFSEYKHTGIYRWNHAKMHGCGYNVWHVGESCVLYDRNLEELFKNTELKYIPWKKLTQEANGRHIDMSEFIHNIAAYPDVYEKLAKVGLAKLVLCVTDRYGHSDKLNMYGDSLEQILKVDKLRVKQAIALNADLKQMQILQCGYRVNVWIKDEDVSRIIEYTEWMSSEDICIWLSRKNLIKTLNYLDKIHKENPDIDKRYIRRDYEDYLGQLHTLGIPVDKHNRFPANFYQVHEEYSKLIKEQEDRIAKLNTRKKNVELKKVVEELKRLYKLRSKNYTIVWPMSKADFTKEGQMQHNCVGRYFDNVVKKKTVVFFLRRAEEPDKPFCTVEFNKGKLIQCRTAYNRNAPDEVMKLMDRISKTYEKELQKAAEQEVMAC